MPNNSKISAVEKAKEIQNNLLPMKYICKVVGLYFSSIEYYKYHRRTPLEEVEDFFITTPLDIEWPPYYLVSRHEFSEDMSVNKEIEEAINLYFKLVKDFCESTIHFANTILDYKTNQKALYERILLIKKGLEAFDLPEMVSGLVSSFSNKTFKKDLSLMRILSSYLDTGMINKWEMEKLGGYPKIYPWSRIEVYQRLSAIQNSTNAPVKAKK